MTMTRDDPATDLRPRIRALEATARALEPDGDARAAILGPALAYAERFLDGLDTAPAFVDDVASGRGILGLAIREEPADLAGLLERLGRQVDRPGINPASGGHLGYIPGGGLYAAAVGDYLSDITNRYPGVYYASPGAVHLEHHLLRWMADLIGYPAESAGTFTSGGSLANLTAVVAARDAHGIRGDLVGRAVVYVSSQTHHSVPKALRIAGLGECVVRQVPLDERYRMRPDALEDLLRGDRSAGLAPWLLVASAGTTDVGAVDPLEPLAGVAADHGLWYHVDGAYGAFFALTRAGRARLSGIERADSVVMDPHKTLFLPYGSGVVLVRRREDLLRAFTEEAAYMQDARQVQAEPSPADLSPELTRPFRGLRLWVPLLLHGVAAFRAALEEKLLLTRYFHSRVAALGYEVGPEPELSVAVYRYVPARMRSGEAPRDRSEINRINEGILRRVNGDGRIFLSSTNLDGYFTLRFACVVHRTHLATVDLLLGILAQAAAEVEGGGEAGGRVASAQGRG